MQFDLFTSSADKSDKLLGISAGSKKEFIKALQSFSLFMKIFQLEYDKNMIWISEFLKRKITSQKSYYVSKRVPTPNCLICHEKLQSIYLLPMPTMVIICCLIIKTWQKERRKKCYSFTWPAASRTSLVRGITIGKTGKTAVLPKFSIALTLSQVGGLDYTHPGIGFISPKKFSLLRPCW